jgi:dienelactone hydrolase
MIRRFLLCATAYAIGGFSGIAEAVDLRPLTFDAKDIGKPNSGARAELWRPTGAGPFPAVVVMHSCGGVADNERSWASRLVGWGYAALVVDSFGPRNQRNICERTDFIPAQVRAQDAFNAAIYLRTLPDIAADRIGVIGFSHGGTTTLNAAIGEAVPTDRGGRPFQAAVAYYPGCSGGTIVTPFATDVLILIGKDDDWTLADRCKKTVEARANQAHPPAIKVYPGAVHGFDQGGGPKPYLGHMVGGNAEAAADSFAMTQAFLASRLKPR